MSAPVVDRDIVAPTPEYYRSTVTGEVLHTEDLDECEPCDGSGEIVLIWRDSYTQRLVEEIEACHACGGHGVVEHVRSHGTFVPEPVEPVT